MSVLDEILSATAREVARLRTGPIPARRAGPPIDVAARLRRAKGAPLAIIAEIKKRSPSAGPLSTALTAAARAAAYEAAGAAMISVLVDRAHFDGGYEDLAAARETVTTPLLCKGFIVDEVQIEAASSAGADAILLIARILDDAALARLHHAARERGLMPIVEVIDDAELDRALALDGDRSLVVGVNARDLATLDMDPARAAAVAQRIPERAVALWFSGVGSPAEVARLAAVREARELDGALIGESLMRRDDPSPLLTEMVRAAGAR
jgi:indole-3-glycerol phosphate synthase